MDIVFIDGDPNILPWEYAARKIGILFQMCKTVDKPLWASGCGMQMLIFYCATNYKQLNVINGNGKGSSIKNINFTEFSSQDLGPDDVILDNKTGDFYQFTQVFLLQIRITKGK